MPTIRATAGTIAATIALGAGSLTLTTPTAQASVPGDSSTSSASTAAASTSSSTRTLAARSSTASTSTASVSFGQRSEAVRALQQALTRAGFPVPATGYFGTITRDALADFQASEGLSATGRATPRTLRALAVDAGSARTVTSSVSTSNASTSSARSIRSSSVASSSSARAAVNFAYAQLGKAYGYGASGPSAYDCSGLTSAAWASAGVTIPRTSQAQWSALPSVSTSALQPGDLVIFYGGGHVGIYVGDGMVIHSPRPGKTVEKVSMSTMPIAGAVRPA